MRQKAALFLAILMAVHTPLISAASPRSEADVLNQAEETEVSSEAETSSGAEETVRSGETEVSAETKESGGTDSQDAAGGDEQTTSPIDGFWDEDDTEASPPNAMMLGIRQISLNRTGSLRIDVRSVVLSGACSWQAELYPADQPEGEERMEEICGTLEIPQNTEGDILHGSLLLTDIPVGEYDLRMTPLSGEDNSYLPYEQEKISIGTDLTTIYLMNDDPRLHGYTAQTAAEKFGILTMGDINNDGILDSKDKEILAEIIGKAGYPRDVYYDRADLDGSGRVDLLDMAAFTRYYENSSGSHTAKPVKSVLIRPEEVTEIKGGQTEVDGSLSEMMAGESEKLQLRSAAGDTITEDRPVEISAEFEESRTMGGFVIDPVTGSDGSIRDGVVTVETEDGKQMDFQIRDGQIASRIRMIRARLAVMAAAADDEMLQGMPIVIDLQGQVAVKKITIKVTKTMSGGSLAEIGDVEFYGDMAERIPQAPMSVPERVEVDNGSESFSLTWKRMPNVTGYEIKVTGENSKGQTVSDTYTVETEGLEVAGMGGAKLVNGNTYSVEVRCVNGAWRSQAAVVTAEPRAMGLPPAPENLVIQSGYKRLSVSWKAMKDTETYNLFYRTTEDIRSSYKKIENISGNRYDLTDLQDETEYEIYLTGINPIGEGPESLHYTGTTVSLNPPETPNYKLINTVTEGHYVTNHIHSVEYGGEGDHQFDIVDGRYDTSWVKDDWDAGHTYPADNKSPIVTLDKEYEMDTIIVIPDEAQTYELKGATLQYWDSDGKKTTLKTTMRRKVSSNRKTYYVFQTDEPFTSRKVQLLLGNTYGTENRISVAEMKFYYYDPIEHDIMGLYTDSLHIVLRPEVTLKDIDNLRARLQIKDTVSGEYHPKKKELETELDNAEKILKDGNLQAEILAVDSKDTMRSDNHITFKGGLNAYQPLGVTALAGETLTVYVGGPYLRDGDATRLELIISQYHGSSKAVFKSLGYLKAGANEITITALDDMNLERGGQLYVEYTGNSGAEQYGVRVSGGRRSAVLDLSDVTDTAERVRLAKEYLEKVEEQDAQAQQLHKEDHASFAWEPENCIYEATDIVTRYGMISTAVRQVLAGLGETGVDEMAVKLEQSMKAFDEMMVLFYQHKGLSEDPEAPSYNRMPVSRINIRYQRMFAGAFMYAGGKHIGIEWPELKGMMGGVPVQADSRGRYTGVGRYFGWGIAHEIGHEINEGAYAVAEVTNNYFSVLAQAKDDNDSVRFKYEDVFKKVTSGTKGKASNVFVQLAMYWQLHLAYDLGGYNYKTFDTNEEQLANLFFARADSYARNPEAAPGAEGNKLTLSSADTDNKLMRLAVAAAGKDILEFFRRWGLEPDAQTKWYASQFEPETRGIWFANDELRAQQLEEGEARNLAANVHVSGTIDYEDGSNQVTLNLDADSSDIRIYEIYRYERVMQKIERRPVGYAEAENGSAVFTDVIGTVNNRAFTYEVIGYDMWLNPTARTEIGSVKVCHRGDLDRSLWEISTNLTNDQLEKPDEYHPDTTVQPGVEAMIDGNADTSFTGSTADGADPEIILHLNQEETITGLSYQAVSGTPIGEFEIYVSQTGAGDWQPVTVSDRAFAPDGTGSQTIYFHDDKKLYTYDASYVRLVVRNQGGRTVTITELSLLGQTGDNIDLKAENGIGILKDAYTGSSGAQIPAGSLVFTGTYKGHPAFNAVRLWDENGELVGGVDEEGNVRATQIIFAPDPGSGLLGEVASGTWVYYIEPAYAASVKPQKVRAELYRVDDAQTNEGERLVSSTLFVDVPAVLPEVTISDGGGRS